MKQDDNTFTQRKLEDYQHFCTVGDLLKFIEKNNVPMDAKILMQRVEDSYFNKECSNGWQLFRKHGYFSYQMMKTNQMIDDGIYNDKDHYPDIEDPERFRNSQEAIEAAMEEYYPCWCPVQYADDKHLYLDAHY